MSRLKEYTCYVVSVNNEPVIAVGNENTAIKIAKEKGGWYKEVVFYHHELGANFYDQIKFEVKKIERAEV